MNLLIDTIKRYIHLQYHKLLPVNRRWGMALAMGFKPSLRDSIRFRRLVLRKDGKRGVYLYSVDGSVDLVLGRTHTKPTDTIPF